MIIFYEKEHCENLLKEKVERKKIIQSDLNLLAKYWKEKGYSYADIKKNLAEYCKTVSPYFNMIRNGLVINRALSYAKKYPMRFPVDIYVSQYELDCIGSLENLEEETFLFCMLVVAKFYDYHKLENEKNKDVQTLFTNSTIKDLKTISGVRITRNVWYKLKHHMVINALFTPTEFSPNCWIINFGSRNKFTFDRKITVSDFRDIATYYYEYKGLEVSECENCGVKFLKNAHNGKLCRKCTNFTDRKRECGKKRRGRKFSRRK